MMINNNEEMINQAPLGNNNTHNASELSSSLSAERRTTQPNRPSSQLT